MSERSDASALSGALVAAALLDALVTKNILTLGDARDVIGSALRALAPEVRTQEGYEASKILQDMLAGRYSAR